MEYRRTTNTTCGHAARGTAALGGADPTARVHQVFESVSRSYDAANDRISLGRHRVWKRQLVDFAVSRARALWAQQGAHGVPLVLDVCCGTGDIVEQIARSNPDVLVVGLDFSAGMLQVAHRRLDGLPNVLLVEGDAMNLPFDDAVFGAATISFGLRNTPDYAHVVGEMCRVVRPGGAVACLDASVPELPLVQPFYQFYYRNIMTLLGGGVAKHAEYEWLYRSTQEFLTKQQLADLFSACGLSDVRCKPFMFGAAALHTGVRC